MVEFKLRLRAVTLPTGLPVTIEGHVAVGLNALLDLETYYKLLEGGSSRATR
ncbi:MAG: hypothetical protein ABWK01_07025 [Infirmifilum sp.]